MTTKTPAASSMQTAAIIYGLIALFLLLTAAKDAPHAFEMLLAGDNDDIMRWLSIKDWQAGQSWFDMTQYRLFAPEGLAMHWSRYVDAGIAGLHSVLAFGMDETAAARWTLVLWPVLLMLLLLPVVAWGARQVFGPRAAIIAMLVVITWFPLRGINFTHGRIDHHNIQILLISVVALAMVHSGKSLLWGAIAGLSGAASLAIGLETLPFVGMAGIILALRASWGATGAEARLIGFCATLFFGSVLLFIGQTAPANWFVGHCDVMSTPVFALILVASGASVLPLALKRHLRTPALRIGAIVITTLLGLALFAPLLRDCAGGPYGALPPEVLTLIKTRVSEAQPALLFASSQPKGAAVMLLPLIVAAGLGSLFWLRNAQGRNAEQQAVIWQMLVFGWLGLFASFSQIRLNSLAAPALPFLVAFVLDELSAYHSRRPGLAAKALAVGTAIVMLATQALIIPAVAMASAFSPSAATATSGGKNEDCRGADILSVLNTVPTASILTTTNLGAPLLFATHHTALAAPYHRNPDAFWNGIFPFQSADLMRKALNRTNADYVLLCRPTDYGNQELFATAMQAGDIPSWLHPVDIGSDALLLLRVVRQDGAVAQ